MADHPAVEAFAERVQGIAAAQEAMRQERDAMAGSRRWIAAENAMRRFVLTHRLGSTSLLEAVHNIAGHVQADWCGGG